MDKLLLELNLQQFTQKFEDEGLDLESFQGLIGGQDGTNLITEYVNLTGLTRGMIIKIARKVD